MLLLLLVVVIVLIVLIPSTEGTVFISCSAPADRAIEPDDRDHQDYQDCCCCNGVRHVKLLHIYIMEQKGKNRDSSIINEIRKN